MGLVEKIKKHGIIGSIEVARWHCARLINKIFYYVCWIFPIDEKLILMESEGDLSDNTFALYDYMLRNGYLESYKVVWLVEDVKKARKKNFLNTKFVEKTHDRVSIKRNKYMATCRYYIYDHCNMMEPYVKREKCFILNLWHGCCFKADKGKKGKLKTAPDNALITGKLYIETSRPVFGIPDSKFLELGYPRNDYLFMDNNENQKELQNKLRLLNYAKVFLWMPTFRKSDNLDLNEDYFSSITGLPIMENAKLLKDFNCFLQERNSLCVFKIHHLQAELNVFKGEYSNILVLKDEEIKESGLQLYQFLPLTDCLITDYSSIANDYMLLDKPIIYTVNDYEEYRKSRGFVPDDPIKYFIGDCVRDGEQLMQAMDRVMEGQDIYKKERKEILPEMHTYADGNASERVINFLGLQK